MTIFAMRCMPLCKDHECILTKGFSSQICSSCWSLIRAVPGAGVPVTPGMAGDPLTPRHHAAASSVLCCVGSLSREYAIHFTFTFQAGVRKYYSLHKKGFVALSSLCRCGPIKIVVIVILNPGCILELILVSYLVHTVSLDNNHFWVRLLSVVWL